MSLWTLLDILLRIYHLLTQLFSIFAILGHFFLPFYPHRKWGGKIQKRKKLCNFLFPYKTFTIVGCFTVLLPLDKDGQTDRPMDRLTHRHKVTHRSERPK